MDISETKGLHPMYLNIHSLLPKIDELRYIARPSNAAVIGISESKLDKSITNLKILRFTCLFPFLIFLLLQ